MPLTPIPTAPTWRAYTDRGQLATIARNATTIDTRTYDDGGRMASSVYNNGHGPTHEMLTVAGEVVSTDNRGNMTTIPTALRPGSDPLKLTWDFDNRMSSADVDFQLQVQTGHRDSPKPNIPSERIATNALVLYCFG